MRAVTSASNIFRRAACPGSGAAEMGIRDEETPYSAEGDMLHKLTLARISKAAAPVPAGIVLTPEQAEAIEEAVRLFNQFEADVRRQFAIADDEPFGDECEGEVMVRADNRDVVGGHFDLCRTWYGAGVRILTDFKFGFLEIEEAPDNLQLSVYAAGKYQHRPIFNTAVAIIQPRRFGPRVTKALYTPDAIGPATVELDRIVDGSQQPDAPRIAGQWCTYCKAKLFCDAYKGGFGQLTTAPIRAVATLNNDDLWTLDEIIRRAEALKKEVRPELRRRIEAGECEGVLQPTGSTKTFTDLAAVYRRFAETFTDEPDLAARFMAFAKGTPAQYAPLYAELSGLAVKKARAGLEAMTAGLIVETPKEPSPRRI